MFQENFATFEGHVDADVKAAAPEVRIAAGVSLRSHDDPAGGLTASFGCN